MMREGFGVFMTFFLASVVVAAAGEPVNCDDEDDDAVDGGDVVHIWIISKLSGGDGEVGLLFGSTGCTDGKLYMINVKSVQMRST